jgi:hypothetical protein
LDNCAFWQEWLPTFHIEKNGKYEFYLDDHCFSEQLLCVSSFGIGDWRHWRGYSDHVPIIVDMIKNSSNSKPAQTAREIWNSSGFQDILKEADSLLYGEDGIKLKYGDYIKQL